MLLLLSSAVRGRVKHCQKLAAAHSKPIRLDCIHVQADERRPLFFAEIRFGTVKKEMLSRKRR